MGEKIKPHLKNIWDNLPNDLQLLNDCPDIVMLDEIKDDCESPGAKEIPYAHSEGSKRLRGNIKTLLERNGVRKLLISIFIFLSALILTNPSNAEFNHYLRGKGYRVEGGRIRNFFIVSIFAKGDGRYIGILGNFFEIKEPARDGGSTIIKRQLNF